MTGDTRWGGVTHPLRFDVRVPNDPISVGFVRKAVSAAAEVCGEETAQVVGLLYTELVTNAIVHGELGVEDKIEVDLTLSPQGLRGSVSDPGVGFEADPVPQPRAEGGFGLFILQRLVRRWGVDRSGDRTVVWFEL